MSPEQPNHYRNWQAERSGHRVDHEREDQLPAARIVFRVAKPDASQAPDEAKENVSDDRVHTSLRQLPPACYVAAMSDDRYINDFHRERSERLKEHLSRQPKASLEDALKQYDRIKVLSRAAEVLGSREAAEHWFTHPIDALGGVSPEDYAAKHGTDELFRILGRIVHGVFS